MFNQTLSTTNGNSYINNSSTFPKSSKYTCTCLSNTSPTRNGQPRFLSTGFSTTALLPSLACCLSLLRYLFLHVLTLLSLTTQLDGGSLAAAFTFIIATLYFCLLVLNHVQMFMYLCPESAAYYY